MKRFAIALCATLGLLAGGQSARADWGSLGYGGYQPWWNIFAHRPCLTPEEQRLQRFWHDYYDAIRLGYGTRDSVDWESYYKRDESKRQFLQPIMLWSVPNSALNGPPANLSSGMMMMPH